MAIVASSSLTIVDLNDARSFQLNINSNQPKVQIYNPNDNGTYIPDWSATNVILTPQMFLSGMDDDLINDPSVKIKWFEGSNPTVELVNGTDYEIPTTGLKSLKIKKNLLDSKFQLNYICEVTFFDPEVKEDIVTRANIEFTKLTTGMDGDNATNAFFSVLTNDSHVEPTDDKGEGGLFLDVKTTMLVYDGTIDDSANWNYTATTSTGLVGSLGTGDKKNEYTVTDLTVDSGYVDIVAKRTGYVDLRKRFTIAKSKSGTSGKSSTSYWLIVSNNVIKKDKDNKYDPPNIKMTSKSQSGIIPPEDYKCRFKVEETLDGIIWSTKYTSTKDESEYTHVPSIDIKLLKVSMYFEGGTSVLLDEQVIPVIVDGTNSMAVYVWTPKGNVIKNGQGSVDAECNIYNGVTQVLPPTLASYQWYRSNSTIGDQGAGAGWEKLTATINYGCTGYTTYKLTIPADAITSVNSFLCITTYNGKTYRDVTTITDQTDSIQIQLVVPEGTVFYNGEGLKNVTAKIYQSGKEIDTKGDTLDYIWTMRDGSGGLDPTFNKTGKTIIVTGDVIDNIGNLNLDLWTKQ